MKRKDIVEAIFSLLAKVSIKNIVEYVISGLILHWITS